VDVLLSCRLYPFVISVAQNFDACEIQCLC